MLDDDLRRSAGMFFKIITLYPNHKFIAYQHCLWQGEGGSSCYQAGVQSVSITWSNKGDILTTKGKSLDYKVTLPGAP